MQLILYENGDTVIIEIPDSDTFLWVLAQEGAIKIRREE